MSHRPLNWKIAFVITTICSSSVFASPAPVRSGWQPRKSNPYSALFQPKIVKPNDWNPATQEPTPAKPKIVCGMTVIPADPSIDPKFRFMIPAPDRPTKFTIRAIDPAVCKP